MFQLRSSNWIKASFTMALSVLATPRGVIAKELQSPNLNHPIVSELSGMLCSDQKFVPWLNMSEKADGLAGIDANKKTDTSAVLAAIMEAPQQRTTVITESNELKYLPATQMNTDVLLITDTAGALDLSRVAAVARVAEERGIHVHVVIPGKVAIEPADFIILSQLAQKTGGNLLRWPACDSNIKTAQASL
jgi:hypothetical protein